MASINIEKDGEKYIKRSYWVSIAAIIISTVTAVVGGIYAVYHHKQLKEQSFKYNGIENRPLLKVESDPKKFSFYAIFKEPLIVSNNGKVANPNIDLTLTVKGEIILVNRGNSIAKLLMAAVMDKHSGLAELRGIILDKTKKKRIYS